jgi:predicted ATPase
MYIIQRVVIEGFRGDYTIDVELHEDVNFFVGRNGTGKTTLINIIASMVQCKFAALFGLPFKSAKIYFSDPIQASPPINVTVEKSNSPDIDNRMRMKIVGEDSEISGNFYIADGGRIVLSEDEVKRISRADQRSFFDSDITWRSTKSGRQVQRWAGSSLPDRLRSLVDASWLSINRAEIGSRDIGERGYETTIDQKLKQIYNDIPRYFSLLDARANSEFRKFQETYFLSLLFDDSLSAAIQQVKDLPVDADREALKNIFQSLLLSPKVFGEKLAAHFSQFDQAKKAFQNYEEHGKMLSDDHRILIDTLRIHKVVEKWHEYQKSREQIYLPKTRFSDILTGVYLDKDVIINERNAPAIKLRRDIESSISLHELSSGEKQLFIILGECLLQEGKPWVYIADEPELSLHMEWQLELVSSLRQINQAGQIIFATHSPEILGGYSNNDFDMIEICK